MIVTLSPKANSKLVKWSLMENITESGFNWGKRPTYFVFVANGLDKSPYTFFIDIAVCKQRQTFK